MYTEPPARRLRAADVEPRPGPQCPTPNPRRAKSRRRRSGTGLLLAVLLLCAAGGLPLAEAQVTTSGEEDAAALREAKAAADTSACTGWYCCGTSACPLDSWNAATQPCGDRWYDETSG